jgi:hypothetical protein
MSTKLLQDKLKQCHTFVIKVMFLCKQAGQDMLPSIIFLATRVNKSNTKDWKKLDKIIYYLHATKPDRAKMSAYNS